MPLLIPETLELKYCERCGGLWLRPCGAAVVYCRACTVALELGALPRAPEAAAPQTARVA